jgi:hypothetical protein
MGAGKERIADLSRREAVRLSLAATSALIFVPQVVWPQRPVPKDVTEAWQALERAANSNDYRALMKARLDVGQMYSIISPDLHEDDRAMALKLLEANLDPASERIDAKIAGLSGYYWARFMLHHEDRPTTRRMLPQIRQRFSHAAQSLRDHANISFNIALEAASASLLAGDRNDGLRWLEAASAVMQSNRMTSLGGQSGEALRFGDFSRMGMLKARQVSLAGDAQRAAYLAEVAIGMSPIGTSRMATAAQKERAQTVDSLTAASATFDAVVHLVPTIAGTSLIISTVKSGKLHCVGYDLVSPTGDIFDTKDIEILQWGASYRRMTASGRLGGWHGIYHANDGALGTGASAVFRRSIADLATRFWASYVGPIAARLQASGFPSGSRIGFILPSELSQFPLRLARKSANSQSLNDLYVVSEAADSASLVPARRIGPVSSRSLAGLFNPTGDLPGAEAERALVATLFAPQKMRSLSRNMKGGDLLADLKRNDPTYIYLATHGSFGLSDRAGLMTGNGKMLSFDDLYASTVRLNARLAILSACETAVVNPLAVTSVSQSLPNILLGKGVQGVIASLWKVSDDSTALLMHEMMRRHLVDGAEPPAALRDAQRWLASATGEQLVDYLAAIMDRHPDNAWSQVAEMAARLSAFDPASRPFAEPYHWGAFAYYGS